MPDKPKTILIVDDEPSVRNVLRRCFEMESYRVVEADNSETLREALQAGPIDLITLDLSLAGEDGLQITREIRSHSAVPIIIISGKSELIDTVVGLEIGADDYISKPFELREVLARVRSVLRRSSNNNTSPGPVAAINYDASATSATAKARKYRFDGCTLSTRSRELTAVDGSICELTTAEYDLLEIFASHAHQALSRDQIMDLLKGNDWNPNDRTIDNHVVRLRKKLDIAGSPHSIKTIRGIGYQFTADVTVDRL